MVVMASEILYSASSSIVALSLSAYVLVGILPDSASLPYLGIFSQPSFECILVLFLSYWAAIGLSLASAPSLWYVFLSVKRNIEYSFLIGVAIVSYWHIENIKL